jgi:hypothetical protein
MKIKCSWSIKRFECQRPLSMTASVPTAALYRSTAPRREKPFAGQAGSDRLWLKPVASPQICRHAPMSMRHRSAQPSVGAACSPHRLHGSVQQERIAP